jgi:hypothetical protein
MKAEIQQSQHRIVDAILVEIHGEYPSLAIDRKR